MSYLHVICAPFGRHFASFTGLLQDFTGHPAAFSWHFPAISGHYPGIKRHLHDTLRLFRDFSETFPRLFRGFSGTFPGHLQIPGNRVFARYALCPTFSRRENDKAHLVRGRPLRPRLYTAGFARDISQVTLRKKPRTFLCMAFKYLIPFLYFAKAVRLPSRFNQCHTICQTLSSLTILALSSPVPFPAVPRSY